MNQRHFFDAPCAFHLDAGRCCRQWSGVGAVADEMDRIIAAIRSLSTSVSLALDWDVQLIRQSCFGADAQVAGDVDEQRASPSSSMVPLLGRAVSGAAETAVGKGDGAVGFEGERASAGVCQPWPHRPAPSCEP